jgi:hypothetical protein
LVDFHRFILIAAILVLNRFIFFDGLFDFYFALFLLALRLFSFHGLIVDGIVSGRLSFTTGDDVEILSNLG